MCPHSWRDPNEQAEFYKAKNPARSHGAWTAGAAKFPSSRQMRWVAAFPNDAQTLQTVAGDRDDFHVGDLARPATSLGRCHAETPFGISDAGGGGNANGRGDGERPGPFRVRLRHRRASGSAP